MAEDTEIEVATGSIDGALIFHIVYDVLAFLLYMHQQIPSYALRTLLIFAFANK